MKIQVGQTLTARSACDYDTIFSVTVVKRTPKTVTVTGLMMGGGQRCMVRVDSDGNEYVYAYGIYSMCPLFYPEGARS